MDQTLVAIRIDNFSFILQKLLLSFLQGYFMTLHLVVTLRLKTVIKKSDRQLRRFGVEGCLTVTLLRF